MNLLEILFVSGTPLTIHFTPLADATQVSRRRRLTHLANLAASAV